MLERYNFFRCITASALIAAPLFCGYINANAENVTADDFIIDFSDDNAELYRYIGEDSTVTVPDYIDGVSVNSINENLFPPECKSRLYSVVWQSTLNVPPKIFRDAVSLSDVSFEPHKIAIGESAFENTPIKKLILPYNTIVGNNAFLDCIRLESLTIGNGSTNILNGAFMDTFSLKEIVFPENAEKVTIGENSFASCGLSHVEIPSYVEKIQKDAFNNCFDLKEVTLNGTTDIADDAFSECWTLSNINIDLDSDLNGGAFSNCINLMNINGEPVINDDGSLVSKFEDFITRNFKDTHEIGFINKYTAYCIRKMVNENISHSMTEVQKVKALHDAVCNMVTYDDYNNYHDDVSVFLTNQTICDGYARLMNLLLHEAGFETCYVRNLSHAWLIVKVCGYYFHLDPTWDDFDTISYDWFLKDDSYVRNEPDSHATWLLEVPSSLHSFQKNELPVCDTVIGDVNKDGCVDALDASIVLTEYADVSVGLPMSLELILADCNFNGRIDAVDASKILQIYTQNSVSD